MSEPTKSSERRYALDVRLHQAPSKPPAPAPWPRGRWMILVGIASLFVCSVIAWYRLNGHPIATWIAALPQVGLVFGGVVSVLGAGDKGSDGWHRELASAVTTVVDRNAPLVIVVIAMLDIAVLHAGFAMQAYDIHCPPGFRIRYGLMGAQVACDVRDEQLWMPFGERAMLDSAWCVPPGEHGGWSPRSRYDAWHVGMRREDRSHEEVTCYEDGARVRPVEPHDAYVWVEWGWNEERQQVTVAPCAHLSPGIYEYDTERHECTWLGGPEYLTARFERAYDIGSRTFQLPLTGGCDAGGADAGCLAPPLGPRLDASRALWDAVRDLAAAPCTNCDADVPVAPGYDAGPPDAGPRDASSSDAGPSDADAGPSDAGPRDAAPAAPRGRRCARPGPEDPSHGEHFTFYYPGACRDDYQSLSLRSARLHVEADIPVGISFRGGERRRCVPVPARRDGFIHLFLDDVELVFALAKPSHELVFIERISGSARPATFGDHCPD